MNIQIWTFHRLYIPTGLRTISTTAEGELLSRVEFLELLNKWNAQLAGVWQYWAAP